MHESATPSDSEADALGRLCARYGISTEYVDAFGRRHALTPGALAALLCDADFVPRDMDFAAAEAAAERNAWRRPLPPVQVVATDSESFSVDVRLPARVEHFKWRLVDESGAFHEGAVETGRLHAAQRTRIDGDDYALYHLPLALPLPEGYHRLSIVTLPGETLVICAPAQCHQPAALQGDARAWGFTLQLHGLRSARNWGIGDFTDLADFVEHAARQGADVVGLNPLHALFPHNPAHASPYSPSSRAQLNILYIDVETVKDFNDCAQAQERVLSTAFQTRLAKLRSEPLLDHAGVAAAKHEVLDLLYRRFRERDEADPEVRAFARFREHGDQALHQHALFEALQAHFHEADPNVWGWPTWPEEFRDPSSAAVRHFAHEHVERIGYFEYLQWQAARQLETAGARCAALGMGLGLYLDLAVSVDRAGSDAWRHRMSFALNARVGAPPDAFNLEGQDWGLPPLRPDRLRESQYAVFIESLRTNMRGAGAIRIDHVMMLMRLFWIPAEGTPRDGAYVHYPLDELFAILALESQRHRCLVIGEDLGTVPETMRETLRRFGVLSYRLLYFERNADGGFRAPADYPREAVAAVSTHDLATLAGWWSGRDLYTRRDLGLMADAGAFEQQLHERHHERRLLAEAMARQDPHLKLDPTQSFLDAPAIAAVHGYLAAAPSKVMMVQLEDALGEVEQPNLPGTTYQHPNWRRKYTQPVEALWRNETMQQVCAALARVRPHVDAQAEARTGRGRPSRIPRATYRLQFHSAFGFDDAARIVPYLATLGISHVYCSPIHRARPGSMHGYDVVSHDEVNPELGGMPAFERFTRALKQHGMSQLIDLVPNHMGVLGTDNLWWMDVLENGMASRHAMHFDIQWQSPTPGLSGKVLLPVLGDHYGNVLERGELQVRWMADAGEFAVCYFDHRFPLSIKTCSAVLDRAAASLSDDEAKRGLADMGAALRELPSVQHGDDEAWAASTGERERLKSQLATLAAGWPAVAHALGEAVEALNASAHRNALHDLLEAQAYRLAYWRTAADEINYRRFFDVNELAALRTERKDVFEATHALALELAARGSVDGLRIDHPDGLQDPAQYFERLQDGFCERRGTLPRSVDAQGRPERPLYVVAEKIAAPHEDVPVSWAVHGTTGYRFANVANAVLVEHRSARRLARIWRSFTGMTQSFHEVVYAAKREVASGTLASDLEVLAIALLGIAKSNRRTRDYTLNTLRELIATVAACFTVYRTYNAEEASPQDIHYIDQAIDAARERLNLPDATVFDFVRTALLGRPPGDATPETARDTVAFARRFQQFSAPVAAKGVEDTAFYRYFPLSSLNEVGGEPDCIGMTRAEFHEASGDRQRRWPNTMLATSTHDNKRSEDVRLRIDVLSECPGLWRLALRHWRALNAPLRGAVTAAHEYLLYQTVLGTMAAFDEGPVAHESYVTRIVNYMLKAAREGKVGTSWIRPDAAYEEALEHFVRGVLAPDGPALPDLRRAAARVDHYGSLNGISLTLLKYCSPGVPDIYQGCELLDRSLVDPDNRRAVDYDLRLRRLQELQALAAAPDLEATVAGLAAAAPDGRAKLWIIGRLLALRQQDPELFRDGSYEALEVRGARERHLLAFMRRHHGRVLVVLVMRLFATLDRDGTRLSPLSTDWADTEVLMPAGESAWHFEDCITGTSHTVIGHRLAVAPLLRAFPGAALIACDAR
ncbi:malto-oligosyltrehalose synthase [Variovorax sp. J22R115]|uniref:malto-oligosyltrehalose synthase n=1 Tax=Variovorax sp. J22R115 TaxID=3053509 RepID=UPI0025777A8D|nr:malto-oligosyltrehalose synthase [Variovorax sp. J22R115]MDM0052421.1 malto-oligosyltrehalose synthase [Variovorax sp. J22R115]